MGIRPRQAEQMVTSRNKIPILKFRSLRQAVRQANGGGRPMLSLHLLCRRGKCLLKFVACEQTTDKKPLSAKYSAVICAQICFQKIYEFQLFCSFSLGDKELTREKRLISPASLSCFWSTNFSFRPIFAFCFFSFLWLKGWGENRSFRHINLSYRIWQLQQDLGPLRAEPPVQKKGNFVQSRSKCASKTALSS